MHISDKLANLNWERNQAWKTPFTSDNARPAIYTFDDVYGCYTIPKDKIPVLQDKLRILSGLWLLNHLILCKPIVLRWVQSYLSESKKLI
jgi:cytoplasmic iron level regulating protein YaaA (DUF328/UPF0246 family)